MNRLLLVTDISSNSQISITEQKKIFSFLTDCFLTNKLLKGSHQTNDLISPTTRCIFWNILLLTQGNVAVRAYMQ